MEETVRLVCGIVVAIASVIGAIYLLLTNKAKHEEARLKAQVAKLEVEAATHQANERRSKDLSVVQDKTGKMNESKFDSLDTNADTPVWVWIIFFVLFILAFAGFSYSQAPNNKLVNWQLAVLFFLSGAVSLMAAVMLLSLDVGYSVRRFLAVCCLLFGFSVFSLSLISEIKMNESVLVAGLLSFVYGVITILMPRRDG